MESTNEEIKEPVNLSAFEKARLSLEPFLSSPFYLTLAVFTTIAAILIFISYCITYSLFKTRWRKLIFEQASDGNELLKQNQGSSSRGSSVTLPFRDQNRLSQKSLNNGWLCYLWRRSCRTKHGKAMGVGKGKERLHRHPRISSDLVMTRDGLVPRTAHIERNIRKCHNSARASEGSGGTMSHLPSFQPYRSHEPLSGIPSRPASQENADLFTEGFDDRTQSCQSFHATFHDEEEQPDADAAATVVRSRDCSSTGSNTTLTSRCRGEPVEKARRHTIIIPSYSSLGYEPRPRASDHVCRTRSVVVPTSSGSIYFTSHSARC